jgi:hypothetical protein
MPAMTNNGQIAGMSEKSIQGFAPELQFYKEQMLAREKKESVPARSTGRHAWLR